MAQEDRKLAVIVFTDIAGFTERMAANEDAAFSLIETQRDLLQPIVEKYKGAWIKEMGDGLLLMFDSPRTCVDCCIKLQHAAKPIDGLDIRISVHLGEVIQVSEDVYGDDVNVASRIEKYSPVGGIAISENVQATVSRSAEYETTFIGAPVLKGVGRDIRIYAITSHDLPGPAATNLENTTLQQVSKPADNTTEQPSLLVIPFINISRREEDEVVCDGMTDALISQLSRVDILQAISRTSAMQYKNTDKKVSEITGELGLQYLIEGSILIIGDQIQISASLIDAEKDKQIWSDSYERSFKNILQIFKEVSSAVIDGVEKSMTGGSKPGQDTITSQEASVVDPEAYKIYLKGRQLRQKKDFRSMELATVTLRQSIGIDPTFGAAYAELALNTILCGAFGYVLLDGSLREVVQLNTDRALKLDKRLAEAYIALALTWEFIDHDSEQAARFARQAVTLDPGNTEAIQEEAFILGRLGRFDEAFSRMKQTLSLDPLSTSARNGLGYLHLYQDSYAEAISEMRNLLGIDPSHFLARFVISLAHAGLGEYGRALGELAELPDNIHVIAQRGFLTGRMGETGDAELQKAKLRGEFADDPLFSFSLALIELGMGDEDQCVEALRESQEKHGFIYRDKTIGRDFRMDEFQGRIQSEGLTYV